MLSTIRNFLRSLDRSPLAWPIAIAGALIFALMLPAAMGLTYGDHTLREFWDWKNILFVILTLFTLSQWKISRWFIAIPLVLIFGCYLPAGILYGKPSILVAIALMQTTPAETQEFLMNTPWQLFAEAIGFIFAGLAAIHFFGQVKIPRKTGFVTGLAACAIAWFVSYGSGKTYDQIQTASFFHSFGTTMWYSAEELREEANALPPSWKVTSAEPQYKTYVVIIRKPAPRLRVGLRLSARYDSLSEPRERHFLQQLHCPGRQYRHFSPAPALLQHAWHRPLQQGKQHRHARECRGVRHLVDLEPGARRRL